MQKIDTTLLDEYVVRRRDQLRQRDGLAGVQVTTGTAEFHCQYQPIVKYTVITEIPSAPSVGS